MRHDICVVRRCATPHPRPAADDKREDGVAHARPINLRRASLSLDTHSCVNHRNIIGQRFDPDLRHPQYRIGEDMHEAISMRLPDRFAIMPPKPGDIDELGSLVKQ